MCWLFQIHQQRWLMGGGKVFEGHIESHIERTCLSSQLLDD